MKLAHFLLSPTLLSQTSDPIDTGGGMTRRLFIKRTGGATVATIVAWNLAAGSAKANPSGHAQSTSCTTDLISIEVLLNQQTNIQSPGIYTTKQQALDEGRIRLAQLLGAVFGTRNPVNGCIDGKTRCADLVPNAGPLAPLVTAIQAGSKWKYVIDVPSTGTWLEIRFWK